MSTSSEDRAPGAARPAHPDAGSAAAAPVVPGGTADALQPGGARDGGARTDARDDTAPAGSTQVDSPRRHRVAFAACALLTLAMLAVVGLAWVWSAEAAVWFLAATCGAAALVRVSTSAGGVLRARNKPVDTTILLAAAAALALFAPMASLAPVA